MLDLFSGHEVLLFFALPNWGLLKMAQQSENESGCATPKENTIVDEEEHFLVFCREYSLYLGHRITHARLLDTFRAFIIIHTHVVVLLVGLFVSDGSVGISVGCLRVKLFLMIAAGWFTRQLPVHNHPATQHEQKYQCGCCSLKLITDGPVRVDIERFHHQQENISHVLGTSGGQNHHDQTTDNLQASNSASVPLGRYFEVQHLGQGKHFGILGIFRSQVFVQVFGDFGRDLEHS